MSGLEHARLAPSSAYQWGPGGCPASARMQEAHPQDEQSQAAREGTAAHWYVSEALLNRPPAAGAITPNGEPITLEMVEAGQDFIVDVRDTFKARPGGKLLIESRVSAAGTIHPDVWGTPDAYVIDLDARRLDVWDFKFGHRYVDAFRNPQMLVYAIAALETHGVSDWNGWRFSVTVAQPRNYHPDGPMRDWCFDHVELLDRRSALAVAAAEAVKPDSDYRTGGHCRDCTARAYCPALERVAMSMVDLSLSGTVREAELTPSALGAELAVLRAAMKRIGDRATGLEEQALAKAQSGIDIPGWKADYSKGRERWKVPFQQIYALGQMFGIELRKDAALTPLQARKAGVPDEVAKELSEQPRGAMALVPFTETDIARRFYPREGK